MTIRGTAGRTMDRLRYAAGVAILLASMAAPMWRIAQVEAAPRSSSIEVSEDRNASQTGAVGSWRGTLPRARSVKVVDTIVITGRAAPENGVWAGQYDPMTGEIQVIRDAGAITLAHEYGHALLQDLIDEHTGVGTDALWIFQALADANRETDPSQVPDWLRAVFVEYQGLPGEPYDDVYYGSSFNEYFAESFAWTATRDAQSVPPVTLAFLESLDQAPH